MMCSRELFWLVIVLTRRFFAPYLVANIVILGARLTLEAPAIPFLRLGLPWPGPSVSLRPPFSLKRFEVRLPAPGFCSFFRYAIMNSIGSLGFTVRISVTIGSSTGFSFVVRYCFDGSIKP